MLSNWGLDVHLSERGVRTWLITDALGQKCAVTRGTQSMQVHRGHHGDWKTQMVRPKAPIEPGTVLTVDKVFQNFEGVWVSVTHEGLSYDLDPRSLIIRREAPDLKRVSEMLKEVLLENVSYPTVKGHFLELALHFLCKQNEANDSLRTSKAWAQAFVDVLGKTSQSNPEIIEGLRGDLTRILGIKE